MVGGKTAGGGDGGKMAGGDDGMQDGGRAARKRTQESRTEGVDGRTDGPGTDKDTHRHSSSNSSMARHGLHGPAGLCIPVHSPRTSVGASGTNLNQPLH